MRGMLFAAIACAGLATAFAAADDDRATIQALDDRFSAAADSGDAAALAAFYAPDATVMPPDNSVVTGPAIRTLFAGMVTQVAKLKLTATDVKRLSDDYIREIGVVTITPKGDKPTDATSSYVVVWRKVDGAWKLWTDIFH